MVRLIIVCYPGAKLACYLLKIGNLRFLNVMFCNRVVDDSVVLHSTYVVSSRAQMLGKQRKIDECRITQASRRSSVQLKAGRFLKVNAQLTKSENARYSSGMADYNFKIAFFKLVNFFLEVHFIDFYQLKKTEILCEENQTNFPHFSGKYTPKIMII